MDHALRQVTDALDLYGLLPVQESRAASVCTLVAGEPVRGSWWGHPAGHAIYHVLGRVDAASAKLLWGKVTLVHRRLWAALAAVGEEDAPWQHDGLSDDARALLMRVRAAGELRSDTLGKGSGRLVTELERRLLVVSAQVHTDDGHHARVLKTWERWLPDVERPTAAVGRAELGDAASRLGARSAVPW